MEENSDEKLTMFSYLSVPSDADDWCLRQGSGTAQLQTCLTGTGKDYQSVVNEMKSWTDNDKSSGFIS